MKSKKPLRWNDTFNFTLDITKSSVMHDIIKPLLMPHDITKSSVMHDITKSLLMPHDIIKPFKLTLLTLPFLFPNETAEIIIEATEPGPDFNKIKLTPPTPEQVETAQKQNEKYTVKQNILINLYLLFVNSDKILNNVMLYSGMKHFYNRFFNYTQYNYFRKILKDFTEIRNAKPHETPATCKILKIKDYIKTIEYYKELNSPEIIKIINEDIKKYKKAVHPL